MRCILSPSNVPAFNLAAEEYLFQIFSDNFFFLYVNSPAVVVGKHQNALAEINPRFVRENNIPVIRRLSGGGAVYHDLGNLNFSYHQTVDDLSKISFKVFNEPVVEVLNRLGIPAEISKRNDIIVRGFKVSGHAEHVFRNRILSHGTLLFDVNREFLSKALKNESGTFSGKAIQSVRSKVANISELLDKNVSLNDLIQLILEYILSLYTGSWLHKLDSADIKNIEKLVEEKYSTWEWNFGYSPKYRFKKSMDQPSCSVSIQVEKGRIIDVEIGGDVLRTDQKNNLQDQLLNCTHGYDSIHQKLSELEMNMPGLMDCFF